MKGHSQETTTRSRSYLKAGLTTMAMLALTAVATTSFAAKTKTLGYLLGDSSIELGQASPPGDGVALSTTTFQVTIDDAVSPLIANDLSGGASDIAYTTTPNGLGFQFTGDDQLQNVSAITALPEVGVGGIAVGIEALIQPESAASRQGVVFDSKNNVGISINGNGEWTQISGGHTADADVLSTLPVTTDAYVHAMLHVFNTGDAGAPTNVPGTGGALDFISVLYIDGVAVSAHSDNFTINTEGGVLMGAEDITTPANFFTGDIDDVSFYSSSDFNLFTDNQSVVDTILSISTTNGSPIAGGNVMMGDINLDNTVDDDDVDAFVAGWLTKNRMDGFHSDLYVPDLSTWMNGDLDQNGIVDLSDAYLLHEELPGAGLFAALGGSVPEPSSAMLLLLGAMALIGRRRRS